LFRNLLAYQKILRMVEFMVRKVHNFSLFVFLFFFKLGYTSPL